MSREYQKPPFIFRSVFNFYDEVYPHRGRDDLWIDTIHLLMQCQTSTSMARWILRKEKMNYSQFVCLLGFTMRTDIPVGIRYSDEYAYEKSIRKAGSIRARKKLIHPMTTMNEILAWAFEVYLLPHPKIYLNGSPPAKKVWEKITKEYSEVIRRNGGKPNKETYTRAPLFPVEIMEWGRESICGAGGEEHAAERQAERIDAIRKYRAANGEEHFFLP